MTAFDTQILLVSAQPTPNLLPVLDCGFKPRHVVLVVSPDMHERAGWLESLFLTRKITSERIAIEDPWSVDPVQGRLLDWLCTHESDRVALNLTGGTKLMAIAAQAAFSAAQKPMFYVHPEKNQVVFLFAERPALALEVRIGLDDYLAAHGVKVESRGKTGIPDTWQSVARELIQEIERYKDALAAMNHIAADAKGKLKASNEHSPQGHAWNALTELYADAGLIEPGSHDLRFSDESARSFVAGGWIEHYVCHQLDGMRGELGIQDLAMNLQIVRSAKVKNELDIALLARNRLFIIECKTRRYPGQDHEDAPAASSIYKLDTLRDVGGLNTRCMLASFRPLGHYDRQRAKDLRVQTVEAGGLRNLRSHLRNWINP